jgi:uncharacterized protein with FMN-binding domain
MNRSIRIILSTTAAGAPGLAEPVAAAAVVHTYYGPPVHMTYGNVQVGIKVCGSRMTLVWASAPKDRPQSRQINNRAVPILDREALQAQRVRGVNKVSGASLTSYAFQASLARAMAKAGLAGA